MADSNVLIHTLQLRRFAEAAQNLQGALAVIRTFYTDHNLGTLLDNPANLPDGYVKADYDPEAAILTQIENFLTQRAAFITKFAAFDKGQIQDPLDHLGKKFWRFP